MVQVRIISNFFYGQIEESENKHTRAGIIYTLRNAL